MPNRILREGILTSQRMARLGWAEEVFYRRLHSVVDDFGRYFADVGLLRAACYPRQLNKVSDSDIGKWLTVLVEAALVRVYPAEDGERYLEVLDFGQQVRAKKSRFPNPRSTSVADAQQPPANAHLDVFVSVDVSEGDARAREPEPEPRTATPAGAACLAMKAAGMQAVNPGDPRLLALLEQGASTEELAGVAADAVAKGKGFAWALKALEGRRADAAAISLARPPPVTVPTRQHEETAAYLRQQEQHAAEGQTPEAKARIAELLARTKASLRAA
jgi:hypothetical protein